MSTTALFKPTYRLIAYCILVGAFGALAALGFDAAVGLAQRLLLEGVAGYAPPEPGVAEAVAQLPIAAERWWLPIVTTLGGLLGGLIVYRWAPEAEGHGTDHAISSYHQEGGEVRARIPLIKAVASAFTIGSGGVAGREGPTAQISVGLGSLLARAVGLRGQERRTLLLAGMAAGLAAIFRAPLGMAIFAVEILYSGMVFESEALIYTVISAVTAYALYGFFAGWSHVFVIPEGLTFHQPLSLLGFAALGVAAGLIGALLPTVFYRTRDLFRRIPGPRALKPALGGLIVGLVGMAFPQILGTGYGWVQLALAGQLSLTVVLLLVLLKGPAMSLSIGSGGSGGVFAPTVTVGAMLGAATGMMVSSVFPAAHIPGAAFVVVGMAAVFAGAARTPISTLIMVVEMTGGYGLIVPAMLANVLAFLVQRSLTSGRRYPTLYEHQVERREDSPLHRGVFVRRALEMLEVGAVQASELTLPRLVSLLRYGEPIPVADKEGLLVALEVEPGCQFENRTIADSIGRVHGTTAVAVLRGEEMVVPRGPTLIEAGDQLLVVTTPEAYEILVRSTSGTPQEVSRS